MNKREIKIIKRLFNSFSINEYYFSENKIVFISGFLEFTYEIKTLKDFIKYFYLLVNGIYGNDIDYNFYNALSCYYGNSKIDEILKSVKNELFN